MASESPRGGLLSYYQRRYEEVANDLGIDAQRKASYYQAATQVFTFALERQKASTGKPDALVSWETAVAPARLAEMREEMQRVASPRRVLPAAVA